MLLHPAAVGQAQHQILVEIARATKVDLLEAGLITEPGTLQQPRQPAVVALIPVRIDQMADEFIGGVLGADTALQHPTEGTLHPPQPHLGQLFLGRLVVHQRSSWKW